MREYEMPIEEQVSLLVRKFGTFETKLDAVDDRLGAVEKKIDTIDRKVDALADDVGTLRTQVGTLRTQVEDTNRIAKLSLEGLAALRETTEKRFGEARRDHVEQTDLLKSVLVHVRKRVERVEGIVAPKRRRRS